MHSQKSEACIFVNTEGKFSVADEQLKTYRENYLFSERVKRAPLIEYGRWLLFSSRVMLVRAAWPLPSRLIAYSSANQLRAFQQVSMASDAQQIFTAVSDAITVQQFYQQLAAKLWRGLPRFLMRCFTFKQTYQETVSQLYQYMVDCWDNVFKAWRPECVWVANDHLYYFRALAVAAKIQGVPTAYVQHGNIGYAFPPLHIFDDVWLFDSFSLKRYPDVDTFRGNINYTRKERYQVQKPRIIKRILMCLSSTSELKNLDKVLKELAGCNFTVVIRIHKYIKRKSLNYYVKRYGVAVQSIYDVDFGRAVADCDVCLAGNSSVLAEACANNVPSAYICLSSPKDYYGFVEGGMVPECPIESLGGLADIIASFDYGQVKS